MAVHAPEGEEPIRYPEFTVLVQCPTCHWAQFYAASLKYGRLVVETDPKLRPHGDELVHQPCGVAVNIFCGKPHYE
jgi:hypothetical protein